MASVRRPVKRLHVLLETHLVTEVADIVITYYGPTFCYSCYLLSAECMNNTCSCGKRRKCYKDKCDMCQPCSMCFIPLRYVKHDYFFGQICVSCWKNKKKPIYVCGVYIKKHKQHCTRGVHKFKQLCYEHSE